MKRLKGSITVMMSLCLSVCLLFINTALEFSRKAVLNRQISQAAETALNNLFSRYDGDLFDEFGILLLNTADLPDFYETEELLTKYFEDALDVKSSLVSSGGNFFREKALSVEITSETHVTGTNGEKFCRAVLESMKYEFSANLVQEAADCLKELSEGEEEKTRNESPEKLVKDALGTKEETGKEQSLTDEEQEKYEELVDESIIGKIQKIKENGFLSLILPSQKSVSDRSTTKSGFPSIIGIPIYEASGSLLDSISGNYLFCSFITDHFSDFTDPKKNGSGLMYETEYILSGTGKDKENLESCIRSLLGVREGLNLVSLMKDTERKAEAQSFAQTLVGWTGLPAVIIIAEYMTLGVWAYAEAILDLRTLLGGGKVPLVKSSEEWTLSLEDIPKLIEGTLTQGGNGKEGKDYGEYLKLLLMLLPAREKIYRTMDMVQYRMQMIKPDFLMYACDYAIEAEFKAEASDVFGGYEPDGSKSGLTLSISAAKMY